jgi:hypothetical protein
MDWMGNTQSVTEFDDPDTAGTFAASDKDYKKKRKQEY